MQKTGLNVALRAGTPVAHYWPKLLCEGVKNDSASFDFQFFSVLIYGLCTGCLTNSNTANINRAAISCRSNFTRTDEPEFGANNTAVT